MIVFLYPRLTESKNCLLAGSSNDLRGPSSTENPLDQNFKATSVYKGLYNIVKQLCEYISVKKEDKSWFLIENVGQQNEFLVFENVILILMK